MRLGLFGRGRLGSALAAGLGNYVAWQVTREAPPEGAVDAAIDVSAAEAVGARVEWAAEHRVGVDTPAEVIELRHTARDPRAFVQGAPGAALAEHRCLAPLFDALSAEPNPVPIKAALAHLGLASAEPRLPLLSAAEETRVALRSALAATREVLQHA